MTNEQKGTLDVPEEGRPGGNAEVAGDRWITRQEKGLQVQRLQRSDM